MVTTSRPSCFCVVTICSLVVLSVPAFCAFSRKTWLTIATSCGWLTIASPRLVVQSRSSLSFLTTAGKRSKAFTEGSQS